MSAMFEQGQIVKSRVDAQGLKRGSFYRVVNATLRSTPFGGFVTYEVKPLDGGEHLSVGNGHLVLEEADEADIALAKAPALDSTDAWALARLKEVQHRRAEILYQASRLKSRGPRFQKLNAERLALASEADGLLKRLVGPTCEGCEQHKRDAKARPFGLNDTPVLCDDCYLNAVEHEVERAERAAGWDPNP